MRPKARFPRLSRRSFIQSTAATGAVTAGAAKARAATLIRYPYLQQVTENSAVIVWTTDTGGTGAVRYSRDRSLTLARSGRVREQDPAETELNSPFFRHSVEIADLRPDTTYFYRVYVDGVAVTGEDLSFRTAGKGAFRFLVFGDSGAGTSQQQTLAELMKAEEADLVVHTGDLAYPRGAFADYHNHYFGVYRDMMKRCPFFAVPGNHGYMTGNGFPFVSVHQNPTRGVIERDQGRYYSYDWGNAHFVALDTNTPLSRVQSGSREMIDWLEADLAANAGSFWKIAVFHHPPYAGGPNEKDPLSILGRELLTPILERHGVQLVLSGHEHSYQRSHPILGGEIVEANRGTMYMTSGGGGIFLYPVHPNPLVAFGQSVHHYLRVQVNGARLRMEAVWLDGSVFDRLELAPPPEFAGNEPARSVRARAGLFAPGGLVSLYGRCLGFTEQVSPEGTKERLAGVLVYVNGEPAKVLYSSPGQVNVQLPYGISGDAKLDVVCDNGELHTTLPISRAAPGILVLAHASGDAVSAEAPARAGEELVVYAAGLGEVEGERSRPDVVLVLDDQELFRGFAVLQEGLPGVYRFSVRAPARPAGAAGRLILEAAGIASPPVAVPFT